MNWEVEQKFRVAAFDEVLAKVVQLGARLELEEHCDMYFNHPSRDFAQTDEALRLRQRGNAVELTYKGPRIDSVTKTRRELEFPLPPGPATIERFSQLLQLLGFRPMPLVRKRRQLGHLEWQGKTIAVALDEVEGLGSYVELEVMASEVERLPAQDAVATLATHLDLQHNERRSYLELLLESRKSFGQ